MPPPNPVDALATAAPLATRWIERLLASHEPPLTLAQYLALRAIDAEPLAGADLARRAGVSSAAVSQLIAGLQQAGWIERSPEQADRRRQSLALTASGKRTLGSCSKLMRERLGPLLAGMPRPEADRLAHLLETLEAALTGAPPPRRRPPPPRPPGRPPHRR